MSCPCGKGSSLESCCGPILSRQKRAETAEALMRSRYTAYAVGNIDHIELTHHPKSRDQFDRAAATKWSKESTWEGMDVLATEKGGEGDDEGVVEFVARYSTQGQPQRHHERAVFKRVDGEWLYYDGDMVKPAPFRRAEPKVGRNDPCPCGSGKKHKHCCLGKAA